MAEEEQQEEQADKNKRIRPRERAHGQKKRFLHIRERLNAKPVARSHLKKMTCLFSISKHHDKTCT